MRRWARTADESVAARAQPARDGAPARRLAEPRLADRDRQDPALGRTLYAIVNELGVSFDDVFAASRSMPPRRRRMRPRPAEAPRRGSTGADAGVGRVQRAADRSVIELESGRELGAADHAERARRRVPLRHLPAGSESAADGSSSGTTAASSASCSAAGSESRSGSRTTCSSAGDSVSFDSRRRTGCTTTGDEPVTAVWVVVNRHDPLSAFSRC